MEIKLSAGDKINIPENCKATIEDNLIIIEEKKEEQKDEFKDGDILHSEDSNKMVIFKRYDDGHVTFSSYYNNIHASNFSWGAYYFRLATEEEKQKFFDELRAKGLRWNAGAKELEKIRKRAHLCKSYLYIDRNGVVIEEEEDDSLFDDANYTAGNYYLLEEREQAEEDAKAIKAIFEKRLKV